MKMNDEILSMVPEEEDAQTTAENMAKSISKMYEDRDKKALDAKSDLITQLRITSEKYLTANGVMHALQVLRDAEGDIFINIDLELEAAHSIAQKMHSVACNMTSRAINTDPDVMGTLCDAFYDPTFAEKEHELNDFVIELMRLQLCQNVGPNASDIEDFCANADAEIEKAKLDLREFCDAHDIDFDELCGSHETRDECETKED